MTVDEITALSTDILTQYYENNIQPFFDHCHLDVLWMGPAQNQIIRTKKALVELFEKENNNLHFKIYDLTATSFHISANCTEVLLTYFVDTFWPNGDSNRIYQRITMTWEIKKNQALIRVCHISNPIDYDERDSIYPIHYMERHSHMTMYLESTEKLSFKGVNKAILCTNSEQILYMESIGNHTQIHMASQTFECTERLSVINKRINKGFLRCHTSYLVNPLYVQSIERFALTMTDGKKIPVPEKKYTDIKAILLKNNADLFCKKKL